MYMRRLTEKNIYSHWSSHPLKKRRKKWGQFDRFKNLHNFLETTAIEDQPSYSRLLEQQCCNATYMSLNRQIVLHYRPSSQFKRQKYALWSCTTCIKHCTQTKNFTQLEGTLHCLYIGLILYKSHIYFPKVLPLFIMTWRLLFLK